MIRILVIDDEPDFSDLILKYFSAMGCSVDVAATGEQGLERVTEISPDILIVDNRLPGIDGIEVVRRLRAAKQDVFIVMVTIDKEDGVRGCPIVRLDTSQKLGDFGHAAEIRGDVDDVGDDQQPTRAP